MTMLSPAPLTANSFEHFTLVRNFFGLRPTLGTVLRITADFQFHLDRLPVWLDARWERACGVDRAGLG